MGQKTERGREGDLPSFAAFLKLQNQNGGLWNRAKGHCYHVTCNVCGSCFVLGSPPGLGKRLEAGNEGIGVDTCRMGLDFCKEITITVLSGIVLEIRLWARRASALPRLHLPWLETIIGRHLAAELAASRSHGNKGFHHCVPSAGRSCPLPALILCSD